MNRRCFALHEVADRCIDAALLRDLAERTGGRVLNASDPAMMDLFNRVDLPVPKSPKPVWDFLAILAAVLLILDVAGRRISIEARRVAELAGRAVGKRGEVSTGALSAWQRTRAQVAHRREKKKIKAAEAGEIRMAHFEAGEEDARTAIDVGAESLADTRATAADVPRSKTDAPKDDKDEDGDFTSRLLAAKRRARQQQDQGDEEND